ncbi:MAG: hypothetical protein LRY51_01245 [Geovibrio sp.]|nr:hypothetical protein [Geovibrio sp.]
MKTETEKERKLNSLRGSFRGNKMKKMLFLGDSIANISGDVRLLESEIAGAESTKERLHREIEDYERKFRELTSSRVRILSSKEETEKNKAKLRESLEELEEKIEEYTRMRDDLKYDIDGLEDEYLELTQKLTSINNSVFEKETTINRLEADRKRFTLEKDDLEAEIAKAVQRAEDAQREFEETRDALRHLTDEIKSIRADLSEIKTLEADAKAETDGLRLEKNSLESRTAVLKEQIENAAVGDSGEYLKKFESSLLIDMIDESAEPPMHAADILVFRAEQKSMVLATVREMTGSLRFTFSDSADELINELTEQEKITENIIKTGSLYRKIGDDDKGVVILKLKTELKTAEDKLETVTADFEDAEARYEGLAAKTAETAEILSEKEPASPPLKPRRKTHHACLTRLWR